MVWVYNVLFSRQSAMRFLYSILMYLITPLVVLRLWWKGRSLPAYRQRIAERFCLGVSGQKVDVWVHAVSLGEVIAATPLIDALLAKQWSVLVTTMTPTGSERVQVRFGNAVVHQYLPYDLPQVIKRFYALYQPRVGVIMETELWPNLIYQAHGAGVPLVLANARLSARSFKGYQRLSCMFRPLLNRFFAILPQSEGDGRHFQALVKREGVVQVLGNMKFDLQVDGVDSGVMKGLKKQWGEARPVVIVASTHEGEEALILRALRRLQQIIPGVLLLIAPRHPERFIAVFNVAQQLGFNTALRSAVDTVTAENDVLVVDSLGELLSWYQVSDYAFVGGSLVPVGGHNVLEPIAMGVPVFSGPQVQNFKAICDELCEAKAMVLVQNVEELVDRLGALHGDGVLKAEQVGRATAILNKNKGAVQRHLVVIEGAMGY